MSKHYIKIIIFFSLLIFLQGCETTKPTVKVHGDKPLIDTKKVIADGKKDLEKKAKDGPKPLKKVVEKYLVARLINLVSTSKFCK